MLIRHPKQLDRALASMSQTMEIKWPENIKGWMVAVPARAILRCIYGGPYRAIWGLIKWQVRNDWERVMKWR